MTSNNQAIATTHSGSSVSLSSALLEVHQILRSFAQADGFQVDRLAPAFGDTVDLERLHALGEQFAQGNFSEVPAIAVRSSQELNGAMGVYVLDTHQIYLSESLLLHGTQDLIVAVLLEEIGHHLDTQLKPTDSAGDEGAIFSALVRGQNLSADQLTALQAENDQATLWLDGQEVKVEQAELTVNVAAQDLVDGDTSNVAALLADPGADGLISLREAIAATNNTAGADTITFDGPGTITLNGTGLVIADDLTLDGDLDDNDTPDITISGDANQNGISDAGDVRVFDLTGGNIRLEGLTITKGRSAEVLGGAGIRLGSDTSNPVNASLELVNSVVTGNEAAGDPTFFGFAYGGGLFLNHNVGQTVAIVNTTISNNQSALSGGGLRIDGDGATLILNSTISGNSSPSSGGITLTSSSSTYIVNSTVDGNQSGGTGGITLNNVAPAVIVNSTISNNTSSSSTGGISSFGGQLTLINSIVADNIGNTENDLQVSDPGGQPIPSAVTSMNSLFETIQADLGISDGDGNGNIVGQDPQLEALTDNGGPTQVRAITPGSPAQNAGSNNAMISLSEITFGIDLNSDGDINDIITQPSQIAFDQRGEGFDRVLENTIDIGAFEVHPTLAIANVSQAEGNAGTTPFIFTVTRSGDINGTTTVNFATADGTAVAGSDYTANTGIVTFNPNETTQTIAINIIGDTIVEPAESFTIMLSNPSGGSTITTAIATGTITNDDGNDGGSSPTPSTPTPTTPTPTTPTPTTPTPTTPTPTPTTPTPTTPTSDLTPPNGTLVPPPIVIRSSAIDDIQITFDEAVVNFDLSDLQLTRSGIIIELTGVILSTTDNVNWTLEGLSSLTTADGLYEITLTDNTDIADTSGNPLTTDTSITWQTGQTGTGRPTIDFRGGSKGKTSRGSNQGERIIGTPLNDVLRGGGGDDRIIAGFGPQQFGRDRLFGEGGNDVLKAGSGKDFLDGGAGRDRLFGGNNDDELYGGSGNDRLNGGNGDDLLNGGLGRDRIKTGSGRDTIVYSSLDEGIDTIRDFNPNLDVIDLSSIFSRSEYAADNSFAQYINYVQLVQVGRATHVNVDSDGSGAGTAFTTLARLKRVQVDAISSHNFVME